MMKKLVLLALTALLVLMALPLCTAASAEEEVYNRIFNALYKIVLRTEAGDETLGSGVLFGNEHVLLTAESCCREGMLVAVGEDGEHPIVASMSRGGAALMQLAEPSAGQPLELAAYDAQGLSFLFGAGVTGNLAVAPLYQVRLGMHGGHSALLLSSEEGMLPGTIMADEKGCIVGLTISQHMEGKGTYLALSPAGLRAAVLNEPRTFLDLAFTWEDGEMKLSWQDEKRSDGLYIIYLAGTENSYYTTLEATYTDRSVTVIVPPGHTYQAQVQWVASPEAAKPVRIAEAESFTVPETPFAQFGYQQECCLVSAPRDQDILDALEAMTVITSGSLLDQRRIPCLQIRCSHLLQERVTLPMAVELIAPDGQFFFEEMDCTLEQANMEDGIFLLALDDVFADCLTFSGKEALPAGDYVLRYSLCGKIAGEYPFTLTADAAPAAEENPAAGEAPAADESPAAGVLTGITAEVQQGIIHVEWPASSVPEGAYVMACGLFEGNEHLTYYRIPAGETAADFPVLPERQCVLWVCWSADENAQVQLPERTEEFVILPPQEKIPFTAHGFTNLRCSLTLTESADPETSATFLPEVPITREGLQDASLRLCFQTEDRYEISEESLEHTLLFALQTPEGYAFISEGYYSFYPEYAASDLWVKDLNDVVKSYTDLAGDAAWPAGEYTLSYLIDGMTAGEVSFTLE